MEYLDIIQNRNKNGRMGSIEDDINDSTDDFIQKKLHVIGAEYFINLDEDIKAPADYRRAYELLREVNKNDVVRLVIDTYGGQVDSFRHLHNSLMSTGATTVAEVHSACSAGSLLALSCDHIHVQVFGYMMFHDMSTVVLGKISEMENEIKFFKGWRDDFDKKFLVGFLTDKERERVFDGKDIYMDKKTIEKRLKKWIPIRARSII